MGYQVLVRRGSPSKVQLQPEEGLGHRSRDGSQSTPTHPTSAGATMFAPGALDVPRLRWSQGTWKLRAERSSPGPRAQVLGPRTLQGCPSVLGPERPWRHGSWPKAVLPSPAALVARGTWRGSMGPHCQAGSSRTGYQTWAAISHRDRTQQHKCHLIYMTKWHHYCMLTECRLGQFPKII